MSQTSQAGTFIATIDAANLRTIRWGLMRQLFPRFTEEVELGRYVRNLLTSGRAVAVRIEPHRDASGRASGHQFDIFEMAT